MHRSFDTQFEENKHMLTCINGRMQNLIQISHKLQELCGFSLTDHNRLDYCSENPRLSQKSVFSCQWLGNVDMHKDTKCDQNIPCGSREMNISLTATGRMDVLT